MTEKETPVVAVPEEITDVNSIWQDPIENLYTEDQSEDEETTDVEENLDENEEDSDSDKDDDSGEEDSDNEDEGEDEESEDDEKDAKQPLKKYRATTSDGTQVEIDSDTVFKIKVNNKFQKVKFEELKKNYNGKVFYDEKIRRASEQEKATREVLQKELQEAERVNSRLKRLTTEINESNVLSAIADIGEVIGTDPAKFQADFISGMSKFIDKFLSLSPEGQEKMLLEQRLAQVEKGYKAKEEETKAEQTTRELNQTIEAASVKYNVPIDEMRDAYQALAKDYSSKGIPVDKITLENVIDLSLAYRIDENLKAVSEELEDSLTYEEFNKLRAAIFKQEKAGGVDLDLDDYRTLALEVKANKGKAKASEGLSKKVKTTSKPAKKDDIEIDLDNIWGI